MENHPLADFWSIHSITPRPGGAVNLVNDLMGNLMLQGRPVDLKFPIDWQQDPYNDRSWRFWLHSLIVLEPFLQANSENRKPAALRRALQIALDWITQNPPETVGRDRSISEFAWYDMAVAARSAYLSYLLRAASSKGMLTDRQLCLLGESIEQHADWLVDESNYRHAHNHGLYADAGLYLIARYFPFHPRATEWARVADSRFQRNIRATVSFVDGIHLEHSPAYHQLVTSLLSRFNSLGLGGSDVANVVNALSRNLSWFVMPDQQLVQLGDTNLSLVSMDSSNTGGTHLRSFYDAGYGIYRDDQRYMVLVSAFHGNAHKHTDELTFSLFDRGQRLIVDSGRYGYYYGEAGRKYAVSPQGHNGVVLEETVPLSTDLTPFGSGHIGTARSGRWVAVMASNPLTKRLYGIEQRRLLVYRPGQVLFILDLLDGTYLSDGGPVRYFHFGPTLQVRSTDYRSIALTSRDHRFSMCDLSDTGWHRGSIVRGQKIPYVQGWTFPATREWVDIDAWEVRSLYPSRIMMTAFDLGSTGICEGGYRVRVTVTEQEVHFSVREKERKMPAIHFNVEMLSPGIRLSVDNSGTSFRNLQ